MIFGTFRSADAVGIRLAHTIRLPRLLLKKGHVITEAEAAALMAAGVEQVTGARLQDGELDEDRAARTIADMLCNDGIEARAPYAGRCNLYSNRRGVFRVDADVVARLNRIDESITLATLTADTAVTKDRRVATVKIIPFAVGQKVIDAWQGEIGARAALGLSALRPCRAALIASLAPSTPERTVEQALAATRNRIERLGGSLALYLRCLHEGDAIGQAILEALAAGCDLLLILGATVSKDRGDVVPSALLAAGGHIGGFGMPVEPGNMLLTGNIGDVPVLNLPGCARSEARNGVDIVLENLLSGRPLDRAGISMLGVGGLLGVGEDHAPAEDAPVDLPAQSRSPRIAALVLAAGRSTRMEGRNKLLCEIGGVPMVRRAVNAACAARICQTLVVTGHEAEAVEGVLLDRPISLVYNARHTEGMAGSLRCGLRALPQDIDAVLVLLADMPHVTAAQIDRLVEAFDPAAPAIVAPIFAGRRGNPILWPRRHFAEMMSLSGDTGARSLLERYANEVRAIPVDDDGVLVDIDDRETLMAHTAAS